jgi:hypothetical protein
MSKADDPRVSSTDGVTPGHEDGPAPGPIKENGQHTSYWILSEEERAKGFVRPVRRYYKHVGSGGPTHPTRPLTDEEHQRYDRFNYVLFEPYPKSESPVVGNYWTQERLDKANGCGSVTTMSVVIAETWARDPKFYRATFCYKCGVHLPVSEFVWEGTDERLGS